MEPVFISLVAVKMLTEPDIPPVAVPEFSSTAPLPAFPLNPLLL